MLRVCWMTLQSGLSAYRRPSFRGSRKLSVPPQALLLIVGEESCQSSSANIAFRYSDYANFRGGRPVLTFQQYQIMTFCIQAVTEVASQGDLVDMWVVKR